MSLRQLDPHKAMDYLQILRIVTEPIPGSNWVQKPDWKKLRRDMYRNIGLFHQS